MSPLTPWTGRLLHRVTRADAGYAACAVALAVLAVGSGRAAARHLSPGGAVGASQALDQLELPTALPNAEVTRDDGTVSRFHALAGETRTIVTFYAPWCGPCQEELPVLVAGTARRPGRLVVVVGAEEEPSEVRRKLDNLGLKDLRYYADTNGQLQAGGRVTSLPTTFLLGPAGRIRDRVVGYSPLRVSMLVQRAIDDGGDLPSAHEH